MAYLRGSIESRDLVSSMHSSAAALQGANTPGEKEAKFGRQHPLMLRRSEAAQIFPTKNLQPKIQIQQLSETRIFPFFHFFYFYKVIL